MPSQSLSPVLEVIAPQAVPSACAGIIKGKTADPQLLIEREERGRDVGTTTRTVMIPEKVSPVVLLGPFDEILRLVEDGFPSLTFVVRDRKIEILSRSSATEHQAMQARAFLRHLVDAAARGEALDADETRRLLETRDETESQGSSSDEQDHVPPHFDVPYRAEKRSYFSTSVRHRREAEERRRLAAEGRAHAEQEAARARRRHQSDHGGHVHSDSHGSRTAMNSDTRQESMFSTPAAATTPIVISQGQPVRPKTAGQRKYVAAIDRNTITFGIGPAGTGKTYLAVAKAVEAFETRRVRRIILTRPAVEAGENLGFLPGTLNDKIDPYLRPLYDALSDMLGPQRLHEETEDGSIEVAPLAYMRGRTLNDAFVILDEAQNTTEQQMKMFLTRLGFNTKMVVTGDATQVDLAVHRSGLRTIEQILSGIDSISFVHLGAQDVVRHQLVGKIVGAYNRHDEKMRQARERVREGQER